MNIRYLLSGTALLCGGIAQAHMPYLLPATFDLGKRTHIAVQSAFGEDAFDPEVAMRDAPFHIVTPAGTPGTLGQIAYLRDLSMFEADLPSDGTYRISTGQRLGRKGKMVRVGKDWAMRGEDGDLPKDAPAVDVQSATLAEAYVTRGATTDAALKPTGQALEILPVTHPNAITAGSSAAFILLFDGKPLADTEVTLFRAAGRHDGRKIAGTVRTDAAGHFAFPITQSDLYLLLARHRTAAPAEADTPYRSYTYTLAFDAA